MLDVPSGHNAGSEPAQPECTPYLQSVETTGRTFDSSLNFHSSSVINQTFLFPGTYSLSALAIRRAIVLDRVIATVSSPSITL